MKKIGLLVMQVMTLSFLASCANSTQSKTYSVKFHTNSGFITKDNKIEFVDEESLNKRDVKEGTLIEDPGLNEKMERFTWGVGGTLNRLKLKGWYVDYDEDEAITSGDLEAFDFSQPITSDIDLYPCYIPEKRTKNIFTMILDLNGGSFNNEKFDASLPIFETNYLYTGAAASEPFTQKFNDCVTSGYIVPPSQDIQKGSLWYINSFGDPTPIEKAFPLHTNLKVFVKWGE